MTNGQALTSQLVLIAMVVVVGIASPLGASDWSRFRGPNGSGVSADAAAAPTTWSDTQNLRWSVDLPGRGVSSPIVVGARVYVTCWSGAGADDLVRHLVCYDRATGRQLWDKSIKATVPDEPYEGMIQQTGYAAHTPVSDGKQLFCFFGVSGVYAFDLEGNEQWHTSVGTNFDERHWGTASSPILCGDLVIVTAASESNSIVALRKSDGEQVWKFESPQLDATWSTPVVVELAGGRSEIVLAVPGAVWAFDPQTGHQNWTCQGAESNSTCASAIEQDGIVYAIGGRDGGGLAIRAGGSGDVSESHVLWSGNQRGRIGTAIYNDGLVYWIGDGMANCIDAKTGEKVYQQRLQPPEGISQQQRQRFRYVAEEVSVASEKAAENEAAQQSAAGTDRGPRGEWSRGANREHGQQGRRGGRRGGRGGGFMSQDYASPVAADGKIYFPRRNGEVFVLALGRDFKQLAVNKFAGEADYSATPAIADGEIYLRSSKKLYCIAEGGN